MASETTTRVLEALSSLYSSNGTQESKGASRWLESFQKKVKKKTSNLKSETERGKLTVYYVA